MQFNPVQILILLLNLNLVRSIVEIGYYFHPGRQYGQYSKNITSQPEGVVGQYYVCGLGFLETNWIAKINNCNCRILRCISRIPKACRICNLCDNQLWTQVNSIKVQFCHKDDWKNQKSQVFSTGKQKSRNWRTITCPQNQYANGIRIRLGNQYQVDTGMVGTELRCQDLKHTKTTYVQDNYDHSLSQISQNPPNTFITSFQFKYVRNDKIIGLRAYFGEEMQLFSASIDYGNVVLNGSTNAKIVEQILKENRDLVSIPYTMEFKNSYSVINTWTNVLSQMNKVKLPQGTQFNTPILPGTKISDNPYYSSKRTPFLFSVPQTKTFIPTKTVSTTIPWCYALKAISQIQEQKATAPYTITLKYRSPSTNEIVTKAITGVWVGFVYKLIQTDVSNAEIAGCKVD